MTDRHLSELLELSAERVHVGPPPTETMVASARRRQQYRNWALVGVSTAVAAVIVVTFAAFGPDRAAAPAPPQPVASPDVTRPPGTRLVGIGHIAVAVPKQWATNRTYCGTPQKDTVVIDQPVVEACAAPRPTGVDSVTLTQGRPHDGVSASPAQVSGVAVRQAPIACSENFGPGVLCTGSIYVPSENVSIVVASGRRPVVERLLEDVYVMPARIAVPGFMLYSVRAQEKSGQRYVRALRELGLRPDVRLTGDSGWPSGFVSGVSPRVGTMLRPGDTVTVEVSR
jgi:hypothetical protein